MPSNSQVTVVSDLQLADVVGGDARQAIDCLAGYRSALDTPGQIRPNHADFNGGRAAGEADAIRGKWSDERGLEACGLQLKTP